ncbi:DUF6133 family protein [Proteiniphilum sp. UBA7639]|uniref:DUF6133 family protein n=1 Tax=Proteiniphilum sp. UBA7639 TaxID=1947289 RepID=UPI000E87E380|nr:DUF6133 family protein [Proteiniphilum sp. UBA7639]HAX51039.1 hypothetical protein [Lachnospiraceae bacterium]HBI73406.1 hypothetical protein [Lachnospiraceae bacterium]HCS74967.1 hypothetical protein [Clostridiales bacterium]
MKNLVRKAIAKVEVATAKNKGSGDYTDSGVRILAAIVIGSLILFALYMLFKNYILPKISGQIGVLFNTAPAEDSDDVTGAVSIAEGAG